MTNLSYVNPTPDSPWGTYLAQIDRVIPYLGSLERWAVTLTGKGPASRLSSNPFDGRA